MQTKIVRNNEAKSVRNKRIVAPEIRVVHSNSDERILASHSLPIVGVHKHNDSLHHGTRCCCSIYILVSQGRCQFTLCTIREAQVCLKGFDFYHVNMLAGTCQLAPVLRPTFPPHEIRMLATLSELCASIEHDPSTSSQAC